MASISTGAITVPTRHVYPQLPQLHQQNTGSSDVVATSQNGYTPGELVSYQVNDDGSWSVTLQPSKPAAGPDCAGKLPNNGGLQSEGDNVWSATQSSRVALLGTAGTGTGSLTNGALEASNVDPVKRGNMIVAQRNYQSNAQTIKTQDQILNTLVNLR
ncbi:flagellar hook-basal body complex protein [Shigella flexneri]